jgi:hypothetical protein
MSGYVDLGDEYDVAEDAEFDEKNCGKNEGSRDENRLDDVDCCCGCCTFDVAVGIIVLKLDMDKFEVLREVAVVAPVEVEWEGGNSEKDSKFRLKLLILLAWLSLLLLFAKELLLLLSE